MLRKAIQISKSAPNMDLQPTQAGIDGNSDQSKAYQKLRATADELRRRSPFLSIDQAFVRVFENPDNAELA